MIELINEIYNNLEDELSRTIFENSLLYSFTRDYKFIDRIVGCSFPVEDYRGKVLSLFGNSEVVIYGAGFVGLNFLRFCTGVKVMAFCDSCIEKQGTTWGDYSVISPVELKERYEGTKIIVAALDGFVENEIRDTLLNFGFDEAQIFYLSSFTDLADKLNLAYFSQSIIIPLIENEEVFVDAGSFDFRASAKFIEYCGSRCKKIIAFEPNPTQYSVCVKRAESVIDNAKIYPYGLWDENIDVDFDIHQNAPVSRISNDCSNAIKIKAVKLDDILDGAKATFIKMDIEGAELNALKGGEQTILKYRPKLAICVYHKPEDIWEIPSYILSLGLNYKLYLRHYSLARGETILYAV